MFRIADYKDQQFILDNIKVVGDCWEWTKARTSRGYGHFVIRPSKDVLVHVKAHRAAIELFRDCQINPGMEVMHLCDNTACCNPDHLMVGTHADNMADMRRKGRAVGHRGEKNPRSKLTADQVREIRADCADLPYTEIGRRYGISGVQAKNVLTGKSWSTVGDMQ